MLPVDQLDSSRDEPNRDFEAEFERKVATIKAREEQHRAARGIWLSHHWPDEHDRCVIVAGRPVCRRCLALYPLALAVALASLGGLAPWPQSLDLWIIWALCVPATLDFASEQLELVAFSPRRQLVTTLLLAPAVGRGFAHELDDRWSPEFWGPVLVFCTIWFVITMAGRSVGNRGALDG